MCENMGWISEYRSALRTAMLEENTKMEEAEANVLNGHLEESIWLGRCFNQTGDGPLTLCVSGMFLAPK